MNNLKELFSKILIELKSKETWERFKELNRIDPGKDIHRKFTKEDIIPLTLTILLVILTLVIGIPSCSLFLKYVIGKN